MVKPRHMRLLSYRWLAPSNALSLHRQLQYKLKFAVARLVARGQEPYSLSAEPTAAHTGLCLLCMCLLHHTPAQVSEVPTRVAPHGLPAVPVQAGHLRELTLKCQGRPLQGSNVCVSNALQLTCFHQGGAYP